MSKFLSTTYIFEKLLESEYPIRSFYIDLKDVEILAEDDDFIEIRYKKSKTLKNKRVRQALTESINKNGSAHIQLI